MEKLFTNRASFAVIKKEIESLILPGVKYCDHLESCLASVQEFQSIADEPVYKNTVKTFLQVSQSVDTVYKNKRERKAILYIEEKLSELECYEPICADEYFPLNQAQQYTFVKLCWKTASLSNMLYFLSHTKDLWAIRTLCGVKI